jgi:hypothetical protein
VITGNDKNRDTIRSEFDQRLERFYDNRLRDFASIEEITPMDDEIYSFTSSGLNRVVVVGKEVVASPPPLDAGMQGVVESQMSICDE